MAEDRGALFVVDRPQRDSGPFLRPGDRLPGQELVFVVEVLSPGAWMFMCMLPYHMQMGMMGQLATPGMAMQM